MNQNNEPIRDASVLGIPKMLLLGLQHMFAMFGATILVPILVNSYFGEDVLHVQVTLIRMELVAQQGEQAGFAAAVGTGQTDFPARMDLQRSALDEHLDAAHKT